MSDEKLLLQRVARELCYYVAQKNAVMPELAHLPSSTEILYNDVMKVLNSPQPNEADVVEVMQKAMQDTQELFDSEALDLSQAALRALTDAGYQIITRGDSFKGDSERLLVTPPNKEEVGVCI